MLFQKDKLTILCSASKGDSPQYSRSRPYLNHNNPLSAKILSQIQGPNSHVPVEILAQARAKDPPSQALPKFLEVYTTHKRVGTLVKDIHTGKLIDEWTAALNAAEEKPEVVDMAPAVSSLLAVKDDEELVCPLNAIQSSVCLIPHRKRCEWQQF